MINGGFGMLIDGSEAAGRRIGSMIAWDVTNGIARRAWARNPGASSAIRRAMASEPRLQVPLAHEVEDRVIEEALAD